MTYDELLADVVGTLKRPDLASTRIPSAIKAATLKAHHSDFYYRDLVETGIHFVTGAYVQSFQPSDLFPTFRKVKYVRRWDGDNTSEPGRFYEDIQVSNAVDVYGYAKTEVMYLAGKLLQIRSSMDIDYILFGYYVHPVIATPETYSSWIAEEHPYAIIHEAVRQVYIGLGQRDLAKDYGELRNEEYRELKIAFVDTVPV